MISKSNGSGLLATFPTMFFGMYNIGYQALAALEAINLAGAEHIKDWHWPLARLFSGLDPNSILDCILMVRFILFQFIYKFFCLDYLKWYLLQFVNMKSVKELL